MSSLTHLLLALVKLLFSCRQFQPLRDDFSEIDKELWLVGELTTKLDIRLADATDEIVVGFDDSVHHRPGSPPLNATIQAKCAFVFVVCHFLFFFYALPCIVMWFNTRLIP